MEFDDTFCKILKFLINRLEINVEKLIHQKKHRDP